jgi:hypothetical protein
MIYVYDLCICVTYIKVSHVFPTRKYGFCICINVYYCPLKEPGTIDARYLACFE